MLHVLMAIMVPAITGAVSPVMLTAQTVLLGGSDGRRRALAYAGGAVTVVTTLVFAIVLLGISIDLPRLPRLNGSLDLGLGAGLLVLGGVLALWPDTTKRGRAEPAQTKRDVGPGPSFALGAFSMATDVTTLALGVAAAKEIAAGGLTRWENLVLAAFLVAVLSLPAWAPPAFAYASPHRAADVLGGLQGWLARHQRTILLVLTLGAGVLLVVRGLLRVLA